MVPFSKPAWTFFDRFCNDHKMMHLQDLQRRWVIKLIAGKCSTLQEIVTKEYELVEKIAEVYIQFRNCVLSICKDVKNELPCMVSSLLVGDLHDNKADPMELSQTASSI